MERVLAASIIAFGLVIGQGTRARRAPEDPFLTVYYNDSKTVLCSAYQTANGARVATYQWWLLGFVSGAGHVRSTIHRPLTHPDVDRVLALALDHCIAKPTDTLAATAIAVVSRLDSAQSGKWASNHTDPLPTGWVLNERRLCWDIFGSQKRA
jgi:hypothetical protein